MSDDLPGGPIDPFSDYSLYDIVDDDIPAGDSTEYMGFHLVSNGAGKYVVQYDGHMGAVDHIESDDYDDVLELVDDLNGYVVRLHEFDYQKDKEELVAWAGPIMTTKPHKADGSDLYAYAPMDPPGRRDRDDDG